MFCSRILAGIAGLLLLSSCSVDLGLGDRLGLGDLGLGGTNGESNVGLVVGDEPFAVKAGAAILAQGGDAVDAATAMYFALAVTYPVAGGLGGGGICIVHDPATNRNEEFDFLARDAAGGGAYGVPGNVRGFALMQTAYGVLPWQRVISPGEGYASAGFPISRALAARLAAAEDVIRLDAGLAAEFMDESGHAKTAGTVVVNRDLADTLAAIRVHGVDAFYAGAIAQKISAYSTTQGGTVSMTDLAAYRAARGMPRGVQIGNEYVFLPAPRTGAGAFAGTLFDDLVRAQGTNTGANDAEAAVMVSVKQALKNYGLTSLPSDLGATGFAATDAKGQAVGCAVTMNGPFGSGRTAQDTGVTMAHSPSAGQVGLASAFLTPVVATEASGGDVSLAGAAAGGPNGTASIAYALAKLGQGQTLSRRGDLSSTGVAPYDTVNAIVCQSGGCVALPDVGANGMGIAVPDSQ
jgi:gamma-glutamyltranspeptidase/glutathione hydrolase